MSNYIYTNDGLINIDELTHYGIPGMKWGHRKTQKWATSKHQPSSAKSSILAGIYAATGNKKVGKALDKSNDRDAANWKRAKKEYAKTRVTTDGSKKKAAEKARQQLIDAKRSKDSTQIKASKKAYKAAKKMANIEAKAVKQKYKKEYMKGSTVAGKLYAKYTGSHRLYADMMYNTNNGAYKKAK